MNPARLVFAALIVVALSACATADVQPPQVPDTGMLADAEAAVVKAREAGAGELAPDALLAARRRLTAAREIVYRSADRSLGDAEREQVQQLAEAAELDARLALARTQAVAVKRKRDELNAELDAGAGKPSQEDTR